MSKSVLISIRPEWCEKIASGQKTIEVRKTRPKIDTPFKCYIYETKAINHQKIIVDLDGEMPTVYAKGRGKIIGEFICDAIIEYVPEFWRDDAVYNAVWAYDEDGDMRAVMSNEDDTPKAFENSICMDLSALKKYIGTDELLKSFYGWHISDLVIYDKPKGLSSFCTGSSVLTFDDKGKQVYTGMKRPPQSWCYVEELK